MSWWPKQSTWNQCGLDWGYWTVRDEEWFQGRLAFIKAGKADLRSATAWKHALKFQKKTPKLTAANARQAEECLVRHFQSAE
jgi:hypothetical protein